METLKEENFMATTTNSRLQLALDLKNYDLSYRRIKHMLDNISDLVDAYENGDIDFEEARKPFDYIDEQINEMTETQRINFDFEWGFYFEDYHAFKSAVFDGNEEDYKNISEGIRNITNFDIFNLKTQPLKRINIILKNIIDDDLDEEAMTEENVSQIFFHIHKQIISMTEQERRDMYIDKNSISYREFLDIEREFTGEDEEE